MIITTLDQLQNNDHIALVFPPNEVGQYEVISGEFKSFNYKSSSETNDNNVTVSLRDSMSQAFDITDGTLLAHDSDTVLDVLMDEEEQYTVKIYLICHADGSVTV